MAKYTLTLDALHVESFAALPGVPPAGTPSEFPECGTMSGGDVCCSDGCPDSHTCPDQPSCNRQCTWPECPVAA